MNTPALDALWALLPLRYVPYALAVCGLCAAIDAYFPQPVPGSRWVPIRRLISFIGFNLGNALNRIQPGSPAAADDYKARQARRIARRWF